MKSHPTKVTVLFLLLPALSLAAEAKKASAPSEAEKAAAATPSSSNEGERVNVENIKEKYWARGDETEMGVVQNRLYSKSRKVSASLFGGFITTDPFLSVKSLGGSVGYHFSEYLSAHLIAWKSYSSGSTALDFFRERFGVDANTNIPKAYTGAEGAWSFLYGKLSVLGKKIIYYDFHLLGGMGVTDTETGRYFTPHLGIAQQVYMTQTVSLRVDYRLMRYTETLVEKQITTRLGQPVGDRANWTNSITIGLSFLIGGAQ